MTEADGEDNQPEGGVESPEGGGVAGTKKSIACWLASVNDDTDINMRQPSDMIWSV